ncbi:UNVERIFIED_CONTAM: hypothetical protein GTU68_038945 [Idotea baltica]|nr:hypothetical protein [Idotea baltica]
MLILEVKLRSLFKTVKF